jgi:hypothetical protein
MERDKPNCKRKEKAPMKVLVLVKTTPEVEAGARRPVDEQAAMAAMDAYNDELVEAGVRLAVGGLHASSKGARINFTGSFNNHNASVIDGPFTETKELVAGFWIWQVRSMEEAIAWAKRCPFPDGSASALELRPIHEGDN